MILLCRILLKYYAVCIYNDRLCTRLHYYYCCYDFADTYTWPICFDRNSSACVIYYLTVTLFLRQQCHNYNNITFHDFSRNCCVLCHHDHWQQYACEDNLWFYNNLNTVLIRHRRKWIRYRICDTIGNLFI